LRRIRGGQDQRVLLVTRSPVGAKLAQPFDRPGQCELGAAESLDEISAPADPERLERAELGIDGAVAALHALPADAVARDDALPLEQELGQRAALGALREKRSRQCPAALGRGRSGCPRP
jgi:hypothetical protein